MVKCPHLHRADFPKYGTHVAVPLLKDNGNFKLSEQDLNNLILCLKKALKFLTSNIGSLNMRPRWSGEPLFITTAFTIKSGKIAKKNGKRVVLKKSSTRSLSNAKLVTIKGQKYYQIGKNQYVKASSVIAPIKKANVKATVKGRKNAKVTSTGKHTRSYLSGKKSYKFTAKRSINGKTYYKVSGRNLWIPASKSNIR